LEYYVEILLVIEKDTISQQRVPKISALHPRYTLSKDLLVDYLALYGLGLSSHPTRTILRLSGPYSPSLERPYRECCGGATHFISPIQALCIIVYCKSSSADGLMGIRMHQCQPDRRHFYICHSGGMAPPPRSPCPYPPA